MAMSVRLTARDQAALLALAEAQGISPNELARRIIQDHVRKAGRYARMGVVPLEPDAGQPAG